MLKKKVKQIIEGLVWVGMLLLILIGSASTSAETVPLVHIQPGDISLAYAQNFQVTVRIENVSTLWAFGLTVNFPAELMSLVSVEIGGFLEEGFVISEIDNVNGWVQFDNSQIIPALPQSGSGDLVVLNFLAREITGSGTLEISSHDLVGEDYFPIEHSVLHGQVKLCPLGLCNSLYLPFITQ